MSFADWLKSFFYLLSIRVSRFHDLSHEFGRLIKVNWGHFFIFLMNFCQFHFLVPGWLGSFIIYFDLFDIELSWSCDLGCEFDKLTRVTRVNPIYCCFNIFLKNYCLKFFFSQPTFLPVIQITFQLISS